MKYKLVFGCKHHCISYRKRWPYGELRKARCPRGSFSSFVLYHS